VVKQAALGSVLRLPRRLAHWTAEAAANAKVTIESLASEYAILFRLRDGKYHMAWSNNADPEWVKYWSEHPLGVDRGSVVGRTAHRQADRRLAQYFNSTRDQWIEVVKACVAARGGCTANNAKSAPGFYSWDAGIRRMREIFRKAGWENGDEDGIETIFNPELKKKISVMNADDGTADPTRSPRNRTPKGPAAEKISDLNDQIEMFKRHEIGAPDDQNAIWYSCIFDDGKTVRAELSRPIEFKSQYFVEYAERIFILGPGDWEKIAITSPHTEPESGDLKIDVRRK
jgi:hypothetical protein